MRKLITLLAVLVCMFLPSAVYAESELFTDPDTGYSVYISDQADLLTDGEEQMLAEQMKQCTQYGHAVFATNSSPVSSASSEAERLYRIYAGYESGTLFLIDMHTRNLYIFSDGENYRTITRSYAESVTDNVYRMAGREEYYECASEVFSQVYTLLEGGRIARPMKVITNILLSAVIAVILNYMLADFSRRKKYANEAAAAAAISTFAAAQVLGRSKAGTRRVYDPPASDDSSSGSSGSSHSSGGGSSSSGGSSSGGGGGHRF
ncbi:MAG: TPM domain-containing protein [Erysipelotrichaceae bacterium]|nr:TPM domain-containing protein [Erysipelotrichaceae bacterium]